MVVHVGSRLVRSSKRFVIQLLLDYHLPPEVELGCLMTCEIYGNQLDSCRTIANRDRGIDVGTKADAGSTPLVEIALFVRRNSRPEYSRRSSGSDSHEDQHDKYALGFFESHSREIGSDRLDIRRKFSRAPDFAAKEPDQAKTEFSIPPSGNDSLNTPVSPPRNQDQAEDGILHFPVRKNFPCHRKIFPSRQRLAVTITGTTRQKKDNPSFRNPQSKGKGMNGDLHGTLNYNRWEIQNMKSNGDSEDGTAGGGEGNTALVARVLQEHHPHELELTEDNLEKE
ncbi:hypothetical protein BDB00DRAFT_879732 [Zychaea mexicana]|uniref:uncharacterized protein n=1 Tax=Zychaea mexicana TaxID=64656 RepID=UPI0022FE24B0|nr:uncharacterized protein BDB00DRAFT_879732 [Zychaea mexicana]KAI9474322.1 hypothetical protein BDB00DRAFT_879732 [Zychaea mexicana]